MCHSTSINDKAVGGRNGDPKDASDPPRTHRDTIWREGVKNEPAHKRNKGETMQQGQGISKPREDLFVKAEGLHWGQKRTRPRMAKPGGLTSK